MPSPYKRIHVVVNPASGQNEPIINVLNDVFGEFDVDWTISITRKSGDATEQARQAIADGVDLVAGYGGDGTQQEIASAVVGTEIPMGVLPGGTGNSFAHEMQTPLALEPAVRLLCTSHNVRNVDAVQTDRGLCILRLYVGVEPEQQASRELKDTYGKLAYAVAAFQQAQAAQEIDYRITIDGQQFEMPAMKVYVVNAEQTGIGIGGTGQRAKVDDGLADLFVLNLENLDTLSAAADRLFTFNTDSANRYYWQGKEITIETEPDQPVWIDGEHRDRTPISMHILPGALPVVVP